MHQKLLAPKGQYKVFFKGFIRIISIIFEVITFNKFELDEVMKASKAANLKFIKRIKASEKEILENFSARSAELIVFSKHSP